MIRPVFVFASHMTRNQPSVPALDVVARMRGLATLLGIDPAHPMTIIEYVEDLMGRASTAVLHDERTLANLLAKVDQRFDVSWPSRGDKADDMLKQAQSEIIEVAEAVTELRLRSQRDAAGPDRQASAHAIEEIGDAMLALGRLALALGAASALEPLHVSLRKTVKRLHFFEILVGSDGDAAPRELWRMAKSMAAYKGSR